MTAPTDILAAFRNALTGHATRLCPRGQDVDAWIYAACADGRWTPAELARHVSGTDHGLHLTTGRIRWRLRRAAGLDDTDMEMTD
jgi:hypothetical protein